MLHFDQITLTIDQKPLIKQATGDILPDDKIVLTGTSGSGKSLLLRTLASIISFDSGIITWQNQTITQLTPAKWRQQIGFIQQTPSLIEGTVQDNLKLPFSFQFYQHQPISFDEQWHKEKLQQLGKTSGFLQQDSQNLSGGERQLVNILRCLQLSPALLILDEPTAALDPTSAYQVEQLIIDWQRQADNRAWLWVTHDNQQRERLLAEPNVKHWQMNQGVLVC